MTTLVTDPGRSTPARLASSAVLACQPDRRLVKLVRSGHERAFDAIVERYRGQLVRYCRRILPESRCEDAVQQTFINAHAALRASAEPVELRAWLFAIARNSALNMLRQNGWSYEQIPLDFDGVQQPDQVYEQRLELHQTVAAVRGLPARQREALVMRELEGRSYHEIAVALGTGDGAVRQLLNRARVTLRAAASALIPSSLVERAASIASGDGGAIAQIIGGVGVAGVAKAGATALIAGSLVIGVANAPLPIDTGRAKARAGGATRDVSVSGRARGSRRAEAGGRGSAGSGGAGGSHEGPGDGLARSGSDNSHPGSGASGSTREVRPSGGGPSASGDHGSDDVGMTLRAGEPSGDSGSSGSGSSGPGSSGSGPSGSSGSGSDGSRSGSSGSGSGSSGSGSGSSGSGSGSSGSGSGPSGSGSGSSGSGSGSSGSGSTGSAPRSSGSESGSSSDGGPSAQPISTSTVSGSSGSGSGDPTPSGSHDATDH